MKFKLVIISIFFSLFTYAQKATVSGIVSDKDLKNEPLPFANVVIKGTSYSATTSMDGKYAIEIPEGNHTIVFSFLGYTSKEVTFTIKAGEKKVINEAIGSGSVTIEDVVVKTTQKGREKESALLLDQKNATEIKQSIGAQELARKGVSDVATAVTKTTGVTKQEGSGNIFVRGLGDRYNSTTMNGLPIPSNDPENKNINLEFFSTDIVEFVSIDKVYSASIYGDFAGGNVDINSKEYKGNGFLKIETGGKINTNAFKEGQFALQKGFDKFGFTNRSIPKNPLSEYNFKSLQLDNKKQIAENYGISAGESFNVGSQGKINMFGTASFGNDFSSRRNGFAKSGVSGAGVANKDFEKYSSISYNTNTTIMANIGYKINDLNKLNFNSLYINTSSQTKSEWTGYIVDIANEGNGFQRRSTNIKNTLFVNQILGNHKLFNERINFNWGASYNTIEGNLPDRLQNIFRKEALGFVLSSISRPDNQRYFQNLIENEIAGKAIVDYFFNKKDSEYNGKLSLGLNTRIKGRAFKATQFNFEANTGFEGYIVDPNNLDLFFNQNNYNNNFFSISTFIGGALTPNALNPQKYNGDQTIHSGFVNLEYKFNKLTAILGGRFDKIYQKVTWDTQLDPDDSFDTNDNKDIYKKNAFLPSLTMKYELNEKQNLRLGMSKTYTLPQFKERVPFIYEDDDLQVKYGNPDLYASDDYNLDLKWEMFPKSEELISFTAFGKYIQNPINEIIVLSSTNDISYINTGDSGYTVGGEAEFRKTLLNIGESNSKKLMAGINASYMFTDQKLNAEKVDKETEYQALFTNEKSRFSGASDLLLNADISYLTEWNNKDSNFNATIAYSYFSDRVNAIGTSDRGNLVDKAFGSLDFIVKSKLYKNFGIGLVAKNLLDPEIKRVQENKSGDVTVLSYTKGMNFSLNLNYQF
jgi:outer membrane receptor protein involved in Fe transport